ncbi:MAG: hypothetical protein AAGA12_11325 [Pseudomonadota bacterium]
MNGMINMVVRILARRLINLGVNKGIDMAARRRGGDDASPQVKQQSADSTKRMRQSMRLIRRIGRF